VAVSCYATGYASLVLYKNNVQVRTWKRNTTTSAISEPFSDSPFITSVYRLEAYVSEADSQPAQTDQRTVQVISPGWNRIALPQGSPTRLFVANDFSTGRGDRLYGIFVDAHGHAALYSSATGIDAWQPEQGNDGFPQHMQTSPGVACKNKLWLIGGSSVDPMVISKEVWCYEEDERTGLRAWQKKEDKLNGMPARMGHSCIVFNGYIFVLGGMSKTKPLNDVWRGAEDENTGTVEWIAMTKDDTPASSRWDPRCLFAATEFNRRMYVYGGTDDPDSVKRKDDLWSSADGQNWRNEQDRLGLMPSPGEPVGVTLAVRKNALYLIGSFAESRIISSFMFKLNAEQEKWERYPVSWPWEQYWGLSYAMQSVAFNRFLFLFSLYQAMTPGSRLNVFVPP
jgi:hypothetical protein